MFVPESPTSAPDGPLPPTVPSMSKSLVEPFRLHVTGHAGADEIDRRAVEAIKGVELDRRDRTP